MKYRTLILGRGSYEGSHLTDFIVSCADGADSPEELLTAFAGDLMSLVAAEFAGEYLEEEKDLKAMTHCPACNTQFAEEARYCHRCGYRKDDAEPATAEEIKEAAAVRFQEWFERENHQFHEYEALFELGWECSIIPGGFVCSSAFDRYLLDGDMQFLLGQTTVGVITEVTDKR